MWSGHYNSSSHRVDAHGVLAAFFMLGAVMAFAFMFSIWRAATPHSRVPFLGSIKMAAERSRKEGKPILLDVHSEDDIWCVRMGREIYSNQDVVDVVSREFVPLQLTPQTSKRSRAFCNRFGFRKYPTVFILDSRGNVVEAITDYLSADEFLDTLMEARMRAALTDNPAAGLPAPSR